MLFEQVSPFNFSVPRPGVFGLRSSCQDPPSTGLVPVWPVVILWHRPSGPCPPWSLVWSHTAWTLATTPGERVPATLLLAPAPVASGCPHAPKAYPPAACVGTWGCAGKGQVLSPSQTQFDPFPALGHLCSLLWAPVSSVTSSQRSDDGSGRVFQRVGCSAALPPAWRPHQGLTRETAPAPLLP